MEIACTKHGDYYCPDLTLPPRLTGDISCFGRMRKNRSSEKSCSHNEKHSSAEGFMLFGLMSYLLPTDLYVGYQFRMSCSS